MKQSQINGSQFQSLKPKSKFAELIYLFFFGIKVEQNI